MMWLHFSEQPKLIKKNTFDEEPILSIKFKTTVKRDIEIFEKTAAISSMQTKEAALFSAFKLLNFN